MLERLQSRLRDASTEAGQEVDAELEKVSEQKAGLAAEIASMTEASGRMADVITLNVGGTRFTTSRVTLMSEPSMLEAMFSGRHSLQAGADGSYFIDRDGRLFHHCLNYLRKCLVVPETEAARSELLFEAEYYQLAGLIEVLSGQGRFERELGPLNMAMRDREQELRRLFAQEPDSMLLNDPYVDLIDVFADLALWNFAADAAARQLAGEVVLHRMAGRVKGGYAASRDQDADQPCTLGTRNMTDFRAAFARLTDGVLAGLDFSNTVVAGGGVLACLLSRAEGPDSSFGDSDIDVFFYGITPEQAIVKILALYEQIRSHGDTTIVRSKLAISFIQDYPRRVIQVVLRIYKSPAVRSLRSPDALSLSTPC